jgi:hypothetical protein
MIIINLKGIEIVYLIFKALIFIVELSICFIQIFSVFLILYVGFRKASTQPTRNCDSLRLAQIK